jgi:peptide deformylase
VSTLEIVKIGAPVLREVAREVSPAELASADTQQLIDDLIETMRAANGAGLAANQVGRAVRICVIEVDGNPRYPYKPRIPLTVLVNPVIQYSGGERFANYEGCLSVPDLRGVVDRDCSIRVDALDRHGQPLELEVRGLTAGTYQHEVDHLDGVLFVDRVTDPKTLTTWAEFRRHHEAAFVDRAKALIARYGS